MQRYKNKNCSYNCNWKCDNECQYKKVINVTSHYKKDINETNLDYDDFISIMLKKNKNISCKMMIDIIKLSNDDKPYAEILFNKIYEKYNHFKIFGKHGLMSHYVYIERDKDGSEEVVDYSFINYAIKQNNISLVDTLVKLGAPLNRINMDMLYEYDISHNFEWFYYPLYISIDSNIFFHMIEKHDILNITPNKILNQKCILKYALYNSKISCFSYIIDKIPEFERDYQQYIPIACNVSNSSKIFRYLIDNYIVIKGIIRNTLDELLITACDKHSNDLLYFLIDEFKLDDISTNTLLLCIIHLIVNNDLLVRKIINICMDRTDISFEEIHTCHYLGCLFKNTDLIVGSKYIVPGELSNTICNSFSDVIPFVYKHGVNITNIVTYLLVSANSVSYAKRLLLSTKNLYGDINKENYIRTLYIALPNVISLCNENILSIVLYELDNSYDFFDVNEVKKSFDKQRKKDITAKKINILCRHNQQRFLLAFNISEDMQNLIKQNELSIDNEFLFISNLRIPIELKCYISKFLQYNKNDILYNKFKYKKI
tara:strand:- start:1082 stop:2710 length:1629 start_codon:yes stop_codon:yes gene_type:complete